MINKEELKKINVKELKCGNKFTFGKCEEWYTFNSFSDRMIYINFIERGENYQDEKYRMPLSALDYVFIKEKSKAELKDDCSDINVTIDAATEDYHKIYDEKSEKDLKSHIIALIIRQRNIAYALKKLQDFVFKDISIG